MVHVVISTFMMCKYESDEILSCYCRNTAGDWCGNGQPRFQGLSASRPERPWERGCLMANSVAWEQTVLGGGVGKDFHLYSKKALLAGY